MEKQLGKIKESVPANTLSTDERLVRDILVLHFKQGMTSKSIGHIFSISEEMVKEKISNFAEQFSNKEYLMNVINGLVSMKRQKKEESPAGSLADVKDQEIADLKKRLTEAEIRAEVYLETIRLAESTFGIKIRKKYGAK